MQGDKPESHVTTRVACRKRLSETAAEFAAMRGFCNKPINRSQQQQVKQQPAATRTHAAIRKRVGAHFLPPPPLELLDELEAEAPEPGVSRMVAPVFLGIFLA